MKPTMSQYLKGVPAHFRTPIRQAAIRKGFTPVRRKLSAPCPLTGKSEQVSFRMDPANREILAEAVFNVENDFESQGDGRPHHPSVVAMRQARNELYDDMGWNERPSKHSPSVFGVNRHGKVRDEVRGVA